MLIQTVSIVPRVPYLFLPLPAVADVGLDVLAAVPEGVAVSQVCQVFVVEPRQVSTEVDDHVSKQLKQGDHHISKQLKQLNTMLIKN